MLSRTYTATIIGLEPVKIEVEIDSHQGMPNLVLIGLPTKTVEESKERITAALIHCGIAIRSRRTVVNLAPADIRKSSPTFELAIAIGMAKMYEEIKIDTQDTIFFGELSLNGELKPMRGALPLVMAARRMGFKKVVLPIHNSSEVSTISGIIIHPLSHLQEYLDFAQKAKPLPIYQPQHFQTTDTHPTELEFKDIKQQTVAKRALTIAAAGGHNLLLIGPPGTGKSMLAKAMISILPPLSEKESIEVTTIYSVCGLTPQGLITNRPFRTPHHTISYAGMIGGGGSLRPGEISLAHRGVLFLDEFSEFDRQTIESLRQPLEERTVTLTRVNGTVTFPASFSLIAATNPCPCGWQGSQQRACTCSFTTLQRYRQRLSGPILDRIDLFVQVLPIDLATLNTPEGQTSQSTELKQQVIATRKIQANTLQKLGKTLNAELTAQEISTQIKISPEARKLLLKAAHTLQLTTRGYFRTIKVAQTIAQLEGSIHIDHSHMAESLQYRCAFDEL